MYEFIQIPEFPFKKYYRTTIRVESFLCNTIPCQRRERELCALIEVYTSRSYPCEQRSGEAMRHPVSICQANEQDKCRSPIENINIASPDSIPFSLYRQTDF